MHLITIGVDLGPISEFWVRRYYESLFEQDRRAGVGLGSICPLGTRGPASAGYSSQPWFLGWLRFRVKTHGLKDVQHLGFRAGIARFAGGARPQQRVHYRTVACPRRASILIGAFVLCDLLYILPTYGLIDMHPLDRKVNQGLERERGLDKGLGLEVSFGRIDDGHGI